MLAATIRTPPGRSWSPSPTVTSAGTRSLPLLAALPDDLGFADPTTDSEEDRLKDACQALAREAVRLYFAVLPEDQARAIYATLEETHGFLTFFGSSFSGAEFRYHWEDHHDGLRLGEAPDIG